MLFLNKLFGYRLFSLLIILVVFFVCGFLTTKYFLTRVIVMKIQESDSHTSFASFSDAPYGRLIISRYPALSARVPISGFLCTNNFSHVKKVDLFMPTMGHGGAPPVLHKALEIPWRYRLMRNHKKDFWCDHLVRAELFMPGLWQIRIFYDNGQVGVFNLTIKQEFMVMPAGSS